MTEPFSPHERAVRRDPVFGGLARKASGLVGAGNPDVEAILAALDGYAQIGESGFSHSFRTERLSGPEGPRFKGAAWTARLQARFR